MENAEDVPSVPNSHPSLVKALIAAQRRVKAVAKKAHNKFHDYRYASADAIIDEASEALAMEGLAVLPVRVCRDPQQVDHVWETVTSVDKDGVEQRDSWILVPRRILAVYKLIHESGEEREFESSTPVIPEKGRPEDKAEFGARTENLGYALRDLLLIPREDMAQNTPSARDDRSAASRGPAPRAPQPSPAPAPRTNGGPAAAPKEPTPSGPSTSTPAAAAADSTEPLMTDAQERAANALFTKLKISRSAAAAYVKDMFGKTSGLSVKQGDQLVAALEARIAELTGGAP